MKLPTLVMLVCLAACSNAPAEARHAAIDAQVAAPLPAAAPAAAASPDAGTPAASSGSTNLPTVEKMRAATDAAAQALIDGEWTPGLVVALIDAEGVSYLKYGVARLGGPAVDEDTRFEIGSITEVFTSILLALQVGEGKVKLEQPVAELLPAGTKVPERGGKKVTIEQLATHRAGFLPAPGDLGKDGDPYKVYDAKKLYFYLAHASLQDTPGASFDYSDTSGGLLGFALAQNAKQSYTSLVTKAILAPLGLKSTTFDDKAGAKAAQGYVDGEPVPAWHYDALAGAGALRSSARDLARFVRVQLGLVPEAEVPAALRTAIELTHAPRAETRDGGHIGLAWLISPDGTRLWHNGMTGGFRSYVAFDPIRKRGIVMLANSGDDRFNNVAIHLAQTWNGAPAAPMRLHPTFKMTAAELDGYVGSYPITSEYVIQLARSGNHLRMTAPGQKPMTLWPSAKDKFYMRTIDAKADFERDESGKVIAMTLEQNGNSQRTPRGAPGEPLPKAPREAPKDPHEKLANPGVMK